MSFLPPYKDTLRGIYKKSQANFAITVKIPFVIQKIIVNIDTNRDKLIGKYGEVIEVDIDYAVSELNKLCSNVVLDKPLRKIDSQEPDVKIYNNYLSELMQTNKRITYQNTVWYHAESHFYRQVREIFEKTSTLKSYDYFHMHKKIDFIKSLEAIKSLADYFVPMIKETKHKLSSREDFIKLIKLSLWSSRNNWKMFKDFKICRTPLSLIKRNDSNIICNQATQIWEYLLNSEKMGHQSINIISDNSGYEQITDFCLADFLLTKNFAKNICFNVKRIPWFETDTTAEDIEWIIENLCKIEDENISEMGNRWKDYINDKKFQIDNDYFWTTPLPIPKMKEVAPILYNRLLLESKLIIFKGELNYRRLFSDIRLHPTATIREALPGFIPVPISIISSLKAEIVCDLPRGLPEILNKIDPSWMTNGSYGSIHFVQ